MLDTAYACYYQVQTQMSVCGLDSAYLVAWTEKDINFQEISFDEILWKTITTKSHHLFVNSILPELVGKFYTWLRNMKPPTQTPEVSHAGLNMNTEEEKWCYCHQTESGCMISCDNNHCPVEWFNYTCAGISNASKAKQFVLIVASFHSLSQKEKVIIGNQTSASLLGQIMSGFIFINITSMTSEFLKIGGSLPHVPPSSYVHEWMH